MPHMTWSLRSRVIRIRGRAYRSRIEKLLIVRALQLLDHGVRISAPHCPQPSREFRESNTTCRFAMAFIVVDQILGNIRNSTARTVLTAVSSFCAALFRPNLLALHIGGRFHLLYCNSAPLTALIFLAGHHASRKRSLGLSTLRSRHVWISCCSAL